MNLFKYLERTNLDAASNNNDFGLFIDFNDCNII